MVEKHKVLIMRCESYDVEKIAGIIKEGMEKLNAIPSGNILLKPNVVMAHKEFFPHAFTRPEFVDGVITATKEMAKDVKEISVGERSGITIPTRYNFKQAGYPEVIKKHGVKTYYFDEVKHVPFKFEKDVNLRKNMFFPKPIVDCDFLINLPKFKAHPWTRLTLSLKNFIGIQDDKHRLVDHNSFLEHKIADLQEVIQPKFIAIDGIIAGQKMMLTPTPFDMGAIVMGTNSCAVDTVCAHMVNVDPNDVIHLKLTAERGFGPINLEEITVLGDFPLEEMQKKTRDFQFCMEHIDSYFDTSPNLSCTVGTFPEKHSPDYCWGGCPGSLQESMHIFRAFYPEIEKEMGKVRYVVGKVEGPLNLEKNERVIFAGDCTSWEGKIDGEHVKIENAYKTTSEVDEKKAKSNDLQKKIISATLHGLFNKKRYIHMKGCPTSVAQHVNYLSSMAKIPNINFDSRLVFGVNTSYYRMRFNRFFNHLLR
ncbi:MAG: DUF362 domain-containing protein [Deltaproteobacteria bacterium]|uniref:DUF362 domain-containing protein n=1 Tax=Desulfobacula sp. TaxID=2593537 RepID=UPI0019BCA12D|nr:DUF362 domain-containing protein [Candidatus Desulfobacula maris]MBL6995622.1 DUF362 domain-containing protein [Desulfobacula sp.]